LTPVKRARPDAFMVFTMDSEREQPAWHAMHAAEVAAHWQVDPSHGLAEADAAERLARWGPNRPHQAKGPGPLERFVAQLVQPLVLILIGAGTVTAVLGQWVDAGVIFAVVLVNALVGFLQEGKARDALASLANTLAADATVLRAGVARRLDATQLVPGDVVVLGAGDRVPADLRLVAGRQLRAAEASLTGESLPVDKQHEPLPTQTPLADRNNMGWGGTLVVGGQATGVVVATGGATQTGRIARLLADVPDLATPLTRRVHRFGRQLLAAILALAALTFAVGVLRGEPVFDMFMAAVALAVSAIPEGLPAAMTITLAIGVGHMARRRAIVRRLPAVETLGSTTVICTDKTGTLTENAMTVREIWAGGQAYAVTGHGYNPSGGAIEAGAGPVAVAGALRETLVAGALCNDARLVREGHRWEVAGDPTEGALLVAARKGGLDEVTLTALQPRRDALPFEAERQWMATLHGRDDVMVAYVKGAVEKLLPACGHGLDEEGRAVPLDRARIEAETARMAGAGLRVLALAQAVLPPGAALGPGLPAGLTFVGLAGMIDPPRARSQAAVAACHRAGIRVKMITGDHPGTALAIARQLGIAQGDAGVLTGRDLAALDGPALRVAAAATDVFARVEPQQKLRLVEALQARGEVVAMTGDGVNDAPALRQADIGVAMGLSGTEVAKDSADLVLTDDNFATIEAAVEEGRAIYDNLVKFIVWTLPTNAGEALVVLLAVLAGWVLPMTPLQILWNNMATALLLGMMLAFEPGEPGRMARPPRPPGAPILDAALLRRALLVSAFMLAGAFGLFELSLARGGSLEQARTTACNLFVVIETLYLFNCRSLTRPAWDRASPRNPWLLWGAVGMLLAQLAFTYLPGLNRVFQTAPIDSVAWLSIVAVAAACAVAVEMDKRRAR
jgi:cation-transporting ATPase F